jgi:hypothetical protein
MYPFFLQRRVIRPLAILLIMALVILAVAFERIAQTKATQAKATQAKAAQAKAAQAKATQAKATLCWQSSMLASVSDYVCTKARLDRYMLPSEARRIAHDLEMRDPNWTEYLPDCPLVAPEDDPMWTNASGVLDRIDCFHPGSVSCFRSTESYRSPSHIEHCQQCCYDAEAKLIKSGSGAGTPDFRCSKKEIDSDHCYYDVMPWTALGWLEYDRSWKPNQGMFSVPGNLKTVETGIYLKKGEFLHFTADSRYRVVWGEEVGAGGLVVSKLESGPEGKFLDFASSVMNTLLGQTTGADKPMADGPAAALIGYIKLSDGTLTDPFLVGAESVIGIPSDGELVLGINDPSVKDNEGSFAVSIRRCAKDDCHRE